MNDLISKSKLIEEILEEANTKILDLESGITLGEMKEWVDNQPTVEAVPVVHGEWIPVPSSDMATGQAYECSNCKKMRYGSFLPPFCQMCGADMRKKV